MHGSRTFTRLGHMTWFGVLDMENNIFHDPVVPMYKYSGVITCTLLSAINMGNNFPLTSIYKMKCERRITSIQKNQHIENGDFNRKRRIGLMPLVHHHDVIMTTRCDGLT